MCSRYAQNLAHVVPAGVSGFDSIFAVRHDHSTVHMQLNNHLNFRVKAVNMRRRVIVWVAPEADAIEPP